MIKKEVYSYLSKKRIEKLKPRRLTKLVEKGEKIIQKTIKQYQKPQKQLSGRAGKDLFEVNYNDMKYVLSMPNSTEEENREKLNAIRRLINRKSFTVSGARKQLKKLERGVYGSFISEEMSQSERLEIMETTRGVFAAFTAEEIERLHGSNEIVETTMRFYNEDLSYREVARRAKISLRKKLNSLPEPSKTPSIYELIERSE